MLVWAPLHHLSASQWRLNVNTWVREKHTWPVCFSRLPRLHYGGCQTEWTCGHLFRIFKPLSRLRTVNNKHNYAWGGCTAGVLEVPLHGSVLSDIMFLLKTGRVGAFSLQNQQVLQTKAWSSGEVWLGCSQHAIPRVQREHVEHKERGVWGQRTAGAQTQTHTHRGGGTESTKRIAKALRESSLSTVKGFSIFTVYYFMCMSISLVHVCICTMYACCL